MKIFEIRSFEFPVPVMNRIFVLREDLAGETPNAAYFLPEKPPQQNWERRHPGSSEVNPTTAFQLKRKMPNMAKTKLVVISTPLAGETPALPGRLDFFTADR